MKTVIPVALLALPLYPHAPVAPRVHAHEPLDTDTTPSLEGEAWLCTIGLKACAEAAEEGGQLNAYVRAEELQPGVGRGG